MIKKNTNRQKTITKKSILTCKYCNKVIANKGYLKANLKTHKNKKRVYKDIECQIECQCGQTIR